MPLTADGHADGRDQILVSPNRFSALTDEEQLAAETGLELKVAGDEDDFSAALPRAAGVLLTPSVVVDAAALTALGGCRAVVRYGVGTDNVDLDAATRNGVPIGIVPAAAVEEVALHAVALALALLRRLPDADAAIRAGGWGTAPLRATRRLSTLTVGVLGLGRIGSLVAHHFDALGAAVIYNDAVARETSFRSVSIETLLSDSDIISLHVPVTAATTGLISGAAIETMRPGAMIVNASRGGLIDEAAVAAALGEGRIGGVGLDVFATEPLPDDSPLRRSPRTILTPHVGWYSQEASAAYQSEAVAELAVALRGERMPNVVNGEVYATAPPARDAS